MTTTLKFGFTALGLLALVACNNNDRAPMDGRQAVDHQVYRGAVPQGFRNDATPDAFEQQGAEAAAAAGPALTAFSLAAAVPAFGIADSTDPTAPKIPDANRCQSLTSVMGPMLERANAVQVLGVSLTDTGEDELCSAVFAPLGVSFPNVVAALRGQLAAVTQLGLASDDCTGVNKIDQGGPEGAVRIELTAKTAEPGAYLAGFTLDRFVAGVTGGSSQGTLALRGEAELRSNATVPASGLRAYRTQWVGIGTVIGPGAQTISSERRELWTATQDGNPKVVESIVRDSKVTLGVGPTPTLMEETKFEATGGAGVARSRLVTATVLPNGASGLTVDVTTQDGADAAKAYTIVMIPGRGLEPVCRVTLRT